MAEPILSLRQLGRATLARQGLLEPISAPSAGAAVERLVSLQAQHPEWPPVALAARAADHATADLAGALERREAVRSSLMRNTIHVVAAADLWPMFAVCQPLRLNQWRLMAGADPVDSSFGRRILAVHRLAIEALRAAPRSSLELDRLMMSEIRPEAARTSPRTGRVPESRVVARAAWRHFAAFVPMVHVPHDGEGYGRSRYAIASDWLGHERPEIDERAARVHLARRYLAAFGPAGVDDLIAYVGRGKGGITIWRDALAALDGELVTYRTDDGRVVLDLVEAPRPSPDHPAPPRLLARWDSLLLSHAPKHRDRVIADEHRSTVFSRNADVLPTFLLDGVVAGTWSLARAEGHVSVMLRPFRRMARQQRDALVAETERVLAVLAGGAERRTVSVAS
jgi:hypothetical protein